MYNMGKLIAVCFLFCGLIVHSQTTITLKKKGITRAVVIGISDYQDAEIADLSYAHLDARSFAEFLQSKSGGQLADHQLKLLTNEQATLAAIQSALEWLLKSANPADQAILYFSGHGDVETKNELEKGYLLAWDTPKNNYRMNALDLDYLNGQIIGQLSRNGAKVIVITDACHSGTLAGEQAGGKEATAIELMKRYAGEIKIMSCQPYELSMEGSRWGRGVFSYYLIDGLTGRADEDGDRQVDLYELENFLQEHVRAETNKKQHPDVFGGLKKESLFWVDEAALAKLKSLEKAEIQRDFEKDILLKLASESGFVNYVNFTESLKKGRLLSPKGAAAVYYYDALYSDTTFIPLRGIIDDLLTVALMDSVQQAIMAYLKTDPAELAQRFRFDQKYARFPEYLRRTAEILGPKDSRYRQTLAKQYYFEGLYLRMQGQQAENRDSFYRLARAKQETALELESHAAFIHNELGLLLPELGEWEAGKTHLQKAISLSPTWAIPYNNLAVIWKEADSLHLAKINYLKAVSLKPDFSSAFSNLGNLLIDLEQPDSAETMYRQAIALDSSYKDNFFHLGLLLSGWEGREQEAEKLYLQALSIDSNYAEAWFELGNLYDFLDQPEAAETHYHKAIELKPDYSEAYRNLAIHYMMYDRLEAAEKIFLDAVKADPEEPMVYFSLCTFYAIREMEDEALDFLQKTLQQADSAGEDYYEQITTDENLAPLRKNRRYKGIMKQYFPDRR